MTTGRINQVAAFLAHPLRNSEAPAVKQSVRAQEGCRSRLRRRSAHQSCEGPPARALQPGRELPSLDSSLNVPPARTNDSEVPSPGVNTLDGGALPQGRPLRQPARAALGCAVHPSRRGPSWQSVFRYVCTSCRSTNSKTVTANARLVGRGPSGRMGARATHRAR